MIKGFKVFNPDWTCRGFQYEVGKMYGEDVKLEVCERGIRFYIIAADCFNHCDFNPNNKVAEVIAHGDVIEKGDKCITNKLEIVREIPWAELLELVNTGKSNTGLRNIGNHNNGNYNNGDRNNGNYNNGNYNIGDSNNGYRNNGYSNNGNSNIGDFNKTSSVIGCFNTEIHNAGGGKLLFFDQETDMTFEEWRSSDACAIMDQVSFYPTQWISANEMTDSEKTAHPEHETTGGYLKSCDNSDCYSKRWNELTPDEKEIIRQIPNFNANKFSEITGIGVELL